MKINEYILLFLKDNPMKIPSIKFWASTLLILNTRVIKIQMDNGHYLTPEDCYKEMDDLANGIIYEGGWVRSWFEQLQWLRGIGERKRWM